MSEKPRNCRSCGFETVDLTEYPRRRAVDYAEGCETKWLCELCASTDAGTAVDYPTQFTDIASLRTICYVGNVILSALRERGDRSATDEQLLSGVDQKVVDYLARKP